MCAVKSDTCVQVGTPPLVLDTPPGGGLVDGHAPLGGGHVVLLFGFQNMVTLFMPPLVKFRHEPTHTLRSTSKVLLRVPTPREARRVATRERAFSVVAPPLWNDLPEEARLAPTLLSFRCQVKTYLFSQALNMC